MEENNNEFLSYQELKDRTIYYIKFKNNYVLKNTLDKLPNDSQDTIDFGRVSWEQQPKELQAYYKAYDYAVYELGRDEFVNHPIKFYEAYVANPEEFDPPKRESLGLLSEFIQTKITLSMDLVVDNYDGYCIGNSHAGNFLEALHALELDFSIVQEYIDENFARVIIQCDNQDDLINFEYEIKRKALQHDKLLGDGKYFD